MIVRVGWREENSSKRSDYLCLFMFLCKLQHLIVHSPILQLVHVVVARLQAEEESSSFSGFALLLLLLLLKTNTNFASRE